MIKEYRIAGFVQGVGYRYFVKELADKLGLKGLVENLNNGEVRVLVNFHDQTEKTNITEKKIINALKKGPSRSKVTGITISTGKENSRDLSKDIFIIKY